MGCASIGAWVRTRKGPFQSGLVMLTWHPGGFLEPQLQTDILLHVLWALTSPLGTSKAGLGVPGLLAKCRPDDTLLPTSIRVSQRPPVLLQKGSCSLPTHSHSRGTCFLPVSPPVTWIYTILTPSVVIFHKKRMCACCKLIIISFHVSS